MTLTIMFSSHFDAALDVRTCFHNELTTPIHFIGSTTIGTQSCNDCFSCKETSGAFIQYLYWLDIEMS
jgi:hypothetical protein